jgi:steroid 5-alpha reductase family enzyme
MSKEKTLQAFGLCAIAYFISGIAAWLSWYYFKDQNLYIIVGIADMAATLVIFGFSYAYKNSSFYDPYWSIIPIPIVFFLFLNPVAADVNFYRQLLVVFLVNFWAIRLTYNWARQWQGLHHEDWRYVDLQQKTGAMYWMVSLTGIHIFPTVLVYMSCLPLFPTLTTESAALNTIDLLAFIVTFGAVCIEWTADEQLKKFRDSNRDPQNFMKTGLWAYSRHPNYFGEMFFWWGLFLFAIAANPAYWWTGIGALSISAMFLFITIPMMDNKVLSRRPAYAMHMKKVSTIFFWFAKK